ncbi:ImcF-related family protein [Paraburkholderia sp. BL21I4N1]|uniref:ImcF-related family protein n=1 Tax=Paraburkholderia sp. BL21I4N1 TaxID=1938801 RepID=UPI000CFCDD8F|nr:ImcF-related family protein [Paraburkholderia sp. BL21I4N1]PQV48096.1 type VI secretion system protein ImpL [Paraburkholderia sp. BL21I4N1]
MTNARNNMQMLGMAETESADSGTLIAWGLIALALLLAGAAFAVVWLKGDAVGLTTHEARLNVTIWILVGLVVVLFVHAALMLGGAYRLVGRVFRRDAGATGEASNGTQASRLDARLQSLCDELRVSGGWRWRYRTPWLLLSGSDTLIEDVAPGLKRAGAMPVTGAILVHASPDGIEAQKWRSQIRQLRRRRSVDSVVHVLRQDNGDRSPDELARELAALSADLGWAAPVTFLHPIPAKGNRPEKLGAIGAFTATVRNRTGQGAILRDQLAMIEGRTADEGVRLYAARGRASYLVQISAYIGEQSARIVSHGEALMGSHWLRAPLAGVVFAPVFPAPAAIAAPVPTQGPAGGPMQLSANAAVSGAAVYSPQPASLLPTWHAIARRRGIGRRMGFFWPNALAMFLMAAAIAWCGWLTVSFVGNQQLMREAHATADAAVDAHPQTKEALRTQLALQQLMEKLEYRQQHGAPLYLRAGLSRNDAILAMLWQSYRTAATHNLQAPVVRTITDLLKAAGEARADALQSQDARGSTYNALRTYLMLGDTARADASFLRRSLVALWRRPVEMPLGEREDTGQRLAAFYADHLKNHPEWRIGLDAGLVSATRNMLVTQMGLASADGTLYQSILDDVKGKYANASLESLLNGADAHGLFVTSQTVPGVYTRAAWDGMIAAAIDKAASERRISDDWVLTGAQPSQTVGHTLAQGTIRTDAAISEKQAAEELKQRLTARYFAEYSAAWQGMLNSIQWQPASSLSGAIDQLTRLADAQTSPLIALMKSVQYQAQAGRPSQALSDTLVRKAQSLIGEEKEGGTPVVNPLDKPFGPLLGLIGDVGVPANGGNGTPGNAANVALNGVSLSRYLTAVTTMRLKLQQIAGSTDAQAKARSLAQAVFQGKLSELSQARDDAALTAASVGTAWGGFGDAVFAQPLETAWQTILQPAAASLNEAWRASVAAPFNAAMNGRYPFFDTQADASLAELGRYVRPDTGLISRFITTQLAGVLKFEGDKWVPNELAPQALQFDPKFLAGVRQLSTVGAQFYAQGDARERFEIMALPTPNVTRSELSVDGKPIVYFNQQAGWTPLAWPGDGLNGHAGLTWETVNAGTNQAFDSTGDWAFLRLLAKADVKQLDSTRYQLTWNGKNGDPLRYVLRSQVGAGPLELLKLRGLKIPERIFLAGKGGIVPTLPPLPPELQP